ncbi:DUF3811 domain-containing protein [Candidatus Fukatsuia symbiotica]|uniref:DUF3811 domain-containing protein n=1 Tax=Candidatus Fukatsuia symbiotica TaxID=1878942 RepID=A0A2Y9CKB0_9GAMM|nr:DUF3811 domain-containing protein [Candidatus Fukatsuia symbiotica]AWK13278.1 hypothetical protein CCS41_00290 [Candidatus Fukatsuia symbiotica]MEA9444151.1 DUF3811 domain-containing protein [Candidatus Fukatsuia symbiotica]
MKKLTLKEMTASEQLEVKTQLGRARVNLGRTLTNSEQNKIKDAAVSDIMQKRAKLATANRSKRKGAKTTSSTTTFNWSDSISTRPSR